MRAAGRAADAVPLQPSETQARTEYLALIAAFPDLALNADARFELAELQSDRGEHDAAIKQLQEALDKEPSPELTDKVRVRLGRRPAGQGRRQEGARPVGADRQQSQERDVRPGDLPRRRVPAAAGQAGRGGQAAGPLPRQGRVPESSGPHRPRPAAAGLRPGAAEAVGAEPAGV